MSGNVKEIQITLESGEVITGELDMPETGTAWKTVVMIHGSGPSDRHATVQVRGKVVSRNFDDIAAVMVEEGYAVFRYDKHEAYQIRKIVSDARQVVQAVAAMDCVTELYLYGWSEGVRVISELLPHVQPVSGLILQSGLAEGWSPYFDYILNELTVERFRQLDQDQDGILQLSDFSSCVPDGTSVSFSLYLLVLSFQQTGAVSFTKALDPEQTGRFRIEEHWRPLAREIVEDPSSLIRFAENAPGENWSGILADIGQVQVPMLVLHGLNDGWISPLESVKIAKTCRNRADVKLFRGLGHCLEKTESPLQDEGGPIEEEALLEIRKWLKKQSQSLGK